MPLTPEEREAWELYLAQVRDLHSARYDEGESWAWAQLQARLREIKRKREKMAA